jgi:hypothetical protein
VNKLDPGGNESYDSTVSSSEQRTLRSLFDRLRSWLSSERSNTQSILDKQRTGEGWTRAESATFTRLESSYGTVTDVVLRRHVTMLDQHLEGIGEYGEGTVVTRGGVAIRGGKPSPEVRAEAPTGTDPSTNVITLYDSFFRQSERGQLYILAHEGGHGIMGLSDRLFREPARAAASSFPYSWSPNIRWEGSEAFAYRRAGRELALRHGEIRHNDQYICTLGLRAC